MMLVPDPQEGQPEVNSNTFIQNVDRLTAPTHSVVHRDRGTEVLTTDGLLQQLRTAVHQGVESSGASASFGSRPPIDSAAQDLLIEITSQAREALSAALGRSAPFGSVESHIRMWSAAVNESTLVKVTVWKQHDADLAEQWYLAGSRDRAAYWEPLTLTAEKLAKHWRTKIETFFDPPDTREISAACPACEERYVQREKDGQTVQSSALSLRREDGAVVEAKCAACGASWGREKFLWLAGAIGAKPLPELADTPGIEVFAE